MLYADLTSAVAHLRSVPGVRDAAWFATDGAERGVVVSDATVVADSGLHKPMMYNVGPGFLRTLGVPVVAPFRVRIRRSNARLVITISGTRAAGRERKVMGRA